MSTDPTALILATLERMEQRSEQRFEGLEQRFGRLEQRFEGLEQRVERLEERVGRLAADQTQLRVDLMARMDRLQDALTLQRDDMVVNLGSGERAERIAKATSDEVRILGEQVSAMVRQIHRLQADVRALKGDP